jgi:hypothetical protein
VSAVVAMVQSPNEMPGAESGPMTGMIGRG